MDVQRGYQLDMSCSQESLSESNAEPKPVSLNKGGPANKKTRLSNMSESESTSEGSDDRRLPGLVKRQH